MERHSSSEQAAALAGAVARELGDQLTVVLSGLRSEITGAENLAALERASARCIAIAKGLLQYSHRYAGAGRPQSLGALLDDDTL